MWQSSRWWKSSGDACPTRCCGVYVFFFSSRRRHTRSYGDWSSDVCSSDLEYPTRPVWLGFKCRQDPGDPTVRVGYSSATSLAEGLDELIPVGDRKSVV